MWLEVGETEDCMMDEMYQVPRCGWRQEKQKRVRWRQCITSKEVAGGRKDRGLYGGRNVSGARMWLEVGTTEDSMVEAMYKELGCGWR